MIEWIAGNTEECWISCLAIEKERTTQKRKTHQRNSKSRRPRTSPHNVANNDPPATLQRKHRRAKKLVNHGEWSKAMGALLSHGTADTTENVLSQLREKHPERKHTIAHPGPYPGWSKLTENDWVFEVDHIPDDNAEGGENCDRDNERITDPNGTHNNESETKTEEEELEEKRHEVPLTRKQESSHMEIDQARPDTRLADDLYLDDPSLTVSAEDIIKATRGARRLTSGGLQQITPWHLKRAITASSNENCAKTAAHLATRWAKGDYCPALGKIVAESKLIALWKNKKQTDVRPISVGCALRRLLTKAYCSKLNTQIAQITAKTQLGMQKGGYEIGIHAMRVMAAKAKTRGEAILLLDFANAFNTVSRNLLISLTAKMCPELANLTWWLYKLEPKLWVTPDEAIRSSEGTQQGCRLSNPLFALAMQYVVEKIQNIPGLRITLCY